MGKFAKDYQEAIDILADRELDDVERMAVQDLENLIYQHKMRLCDAELLNKLRKITGTIGDLDLKNKITKMVEKEKPKKCYRTTYGSMACPSCDAKVDHTNYCCNCGQKLDWEDAVIELKYDKRPIFEQLKEAYGWENK